MAALRQIWLVAGLLAVNLSGPPQNARLCTDYSAIRRDIFDNRRVGADDGVVSNADVPNDHGAGPNVDIIANAGRASRLSSALVAYGNALGHAAICTHVAMKEYSAEMPNIKAGANVGIGGYIDSKKNVNDCLQQCIHHFEWVGGNSWLNASGPSAVSVYACGNKPIGNQ